jgi:hypothetical protein
LNAAVQRERDSSPDDLQTGRPVPESGFYRVFHSQHRLPKEVTLMFGQTFPRCSKCDEPVRFELIRPVRLSGLNAGGFNVALYELPEVGEGPVSGDST